MADESEMAFKLSQDVQRRFDDVQKMIMDTAKEARDQVAALSQSLDAQLRSVRETVSNNHGLYNETLISLKKDFEAHVASGADKHARLDAFVERVDADLIELKDFHKQAKFAARVWRGIWGVVLGAIAALQYLFHRAR